MNPVQAMTDSRLFEPWFQGPSWDAWRTVLKAAYALPLSNAELTVFRTLAERDPPKAPVSELWTIVGRRGGKDSIASMLAAYYAAFPNYQPHVRPGEIPLVMCLAVDRAQARIIRSYSGAYFDQIALLEPLKTNNVTRDSMMLANDVELGISSSNFRSVRGRAIPCAVLDEVAYWRDADSASPDQEVYNAIKPATATMPESIIVGISSPYRKAGLLWDKFKNHYGKEDDVLVIKAPSLVMNPTLNPRIVADAMEKDPAAAQAEWMGEFRADIDAFIDREALEALVVRGRRELPRASGNVYVGFADAAGGSGQDSFTAAVAHMEHGTKKLILDAVREIRPPFSPANTISELARFFRGFGIGRIRADKWGGDFPVEAFRNNGVSCEPSELTKSDIYKEALPLFNSGRVELLDNVRLINQICSLERRTNRGGRDTIDHPASSAGHYHDDVANAATGALVLAATNTPLVITEKAMAAIRRPSLRSQTAVFF